MLPGADRPDEMNRRGRGVSVDGGDGGDGRSLFTSVEISIPAEQTDAFFITFTASMFANGDLLLLSCR